VRFHRLFFIAMFLAVFIALQGIQFSTPADAKKTQKSCTFCHVEYGSKQLTAAGKYYKKNGTLEGYKPQ
jgi:hypothetical protein